MQQNMTGFKGIATILVFFWIVFSIPGFSQSFSIGVKAGGSINWASFGDKDQKDTFGTKPILGYSAGFQIGFPLKNDYEFLAEGAFSRKGRRITYENGIVENRTIYHFLEGTMLLRKNFDIHFAKNVPGTWFLAIGPEVSYWMGTKGRVIVAKPGYEYNAVFNKPADGMLGNMYYNNINRWLWGIVLSAGVKAPLKRNQKIAVELRFVSGHTYLGERHSTTIAILGFQDTQLTNLKSFNLVGTYFFDFNVQESRKGKSTLKKRLKKTR
jgi:hypothetical protein